MRQRSLLAFKDKPGQDSGGGGCNRVFSCSVLWTSTRDIRRSCEFAINRLRIIYFSLGIGFFRFTLFGCRSSRDKSGTNNISFKGNTGVPSRVVEYRDQIRCIRESHSELSQESFGVMIGPFLLRECQLISFMQLVFTIYVTKYSAGLYAPQMLAKCRRLNILF